MTSTSAPPIIQELITRFRGERSLSSKVAPNEVAFCHEYVEPLLEALGWEVGGGLKRNVRFEGLELDYVGTYRKARRFGVEVKLPGWRLEEHKTWIEKLLRLSARVGLDFLVVTSFQELACYDCGVVAPPGSTFSAAPVFHITWGEYEDKWDALAGLLSRTALERSGFHPPSHDEQALDVEMPRDPMEDELQYDEHRSFPTHPPPRPLRSTRVEWSLLQLHQRWKHGRLELHPDFQRGLVWSLDEQSRFVESVLLRLPLPSIYLSELDHGESLVVIDGQQRLLSVFRFMDGLFSLAGLTVLLELNGRRFNELDRRQQRRFEDAPMSMVIIQEGSDEWLISEVFQRLNPTWDAQEIRHVLYRGPGLVMCEQLAQPDGPFLRVAGVHRTFRSMQAEKLVLRMLAFLDMGPEAYGGDMESFLTEALLRLNSRSDDERTRLQRRAEHSLALTQSIFGEHAFRRFFPKSREYSGAFNAALMDVVTWGFDAVDADWEAHADKLLERSRMLHEDEQFVDAITHGMGGIARVRMRFELWKEMLLDVARNHP